MLDYKLRLMRYIDEHNCPSNIKTVRAESLADFIRQADYAMNEKGIQGVVWIRDNFQRAVKAHPYDLHYLYQSMKERGEIGEDEPDFIKDGRADFTAVARKKGGLVLMPDAPLHRGYVDVEQLVTLLSFFMRVHSRIRLLSSSVPMPHIDEIEEEELRFLDAEDGIVFGGRQIRLVEYDCGEGTRVYDPADLDPEKYAEFMRLDCKQAFLEEFVSEEIEPWCVRPTDMLLVTGQEWPRDKVLIHAEPVYRATELKKARIARIYDCHIF